MKRSLSIMALLFVLASTVSAGDVATFVNLGFSADSRFFMFAQYGLTERESYPYAETYIVDVKANAFVSGGAKKNVFETLSYPGHDGMGALFTLLRSASAEVTKCKIDHLNTGRPLYILLNGQEPKETLEFRDFQSNLSYSVSLVQSSTGEGKNISSSFSIKVTIQGPAEGSKREFVVGNPGYKRPGVIRYRIRQIIVTPDQKSLIFVVERDELDTSGNNVRFMIESMMF